MKKRTIMWSVLFAVLNLITLLNLIVFSKGGMVRIPDSIPASSKELAMRSRNTLPSLQSNIAVISSLRGINYFPSMNGWYYMWTNWNPTTVDTDFGKIASTFHANYVRIIVPADTHFGYPAPYTTKLNERSEERRVGKECRS